jgi:hypothetical protein
MMNKKISKTLIKHYNAYFLTLINRLQKNLKITYGCKWDNTSHICLLL